ncbi:MAG TPA: bifunctional adenosylcobinamide kinase/adenosylcobinamide-phosphate guanylyltransferase [Methylomirabilota bacterium]|nr:bifunctional adenosylcobinamide kinase/adenosylcobinamide-phosphate guanylyltransferase [Methylomirabilota bacterium]
MTAVHSSHLVLGGARSGKSRHAVAQAAQSGRRVAFLATARALDGDMAARIARHRAERPVGWTTLEEPQELVAACRRAATTHDVIVVDCATVWVANLMERGDDDAAVLAAADDLAKLQRKRVVSLVIVSNEVGEGVHPATEVGRRYRDLLGFVNQRLAAAADRVTLMVAGIPLAVKDAAPSPTGRETTHEAP